MRRTKIVCTLGPASNTKEQIAELVSAGMNCARLNFSHGDHDSHTTTAALDDSSQSDVGSALKYASASLRAITRHTAHCCLTVVHARTRLSRHRQYDALVEHMRVAKTDAALGAKYAAIAV